MSSNPGVEGLSWTHVSIVYKHMLPNTLNTNEVKNRLGTEEEFSRRSNPTANATEFVKVNETPNLPHRIHVKHRETGSGKGLTRSSLVRVDKTVAGADGNPVKISAYAVLVNPTGNLATQDEPKNVLANLLSLCATTGAANAVLFDCTGNGAVCLVNGDL